MERITNTLKELLHKKYIQLAILFFIIELLGSLYIKGYYTYMFEKQLFHTIVTEKDLNFFFQTMNHIMGNVDKNNILIMNMLEPSNYFIKIEECKGSILKITLLPSSIETMNLLGTNLRGCYMIENYIFKDAEMQKKMEFLFNEVIKNNKYLYNMNETKLITTYDIVMRINDKHYLWINYIRIISQNEEIFFFSKLKNNGIELVPWIRSKMLFSAQSITLFVLHRSINIYYMVIHFISN